MSHSQILLDPLAHAVPTVLSRGLAGGEILAQTAWLTFGKSDEKAVAFNKGVFVVLVAFYYAFGTDLDMMVKVFRDTKWYTTSIQDMEENKTTQKIFARIFHEIQMKVEK